MLQEIGSNSLIDKIGEKALQKFQTEQETIAKIVEPHLQCAHARVWSVGASGELNTK